MKKLSQLNNSINESVNNEPITFDQMVSDYEILGGSPNMAVKKELAAKYGIDSKKSGEIQKKILEAMRDERKTRKSFTDEDIRWFGRLSDYPSLYKKMREFLLQESIEFVEFMKNKQEEKLKSIKTRQGKSLFDIQGLAKSKDWNYIMSMSERYAIQQYLNFVEFLKEVNPAEIEKKAEEENIFAVIGAKLRSQMVEYKKDFMERVQKQAERIYDNAPKNLKECQKKQKEYKEQLEELVKQLKDKGYRSWTYTNNNEYSALSKKNSHNDRAISTLKGILKSTRENYIDGELNNADRMFEDNVNTMAHKIQELELNIANLQVSNIHDDAKVFKMMITDGEKKFYARSIVAAEYSELVATHLRFIITSRK